MAVAVPFCNRCGEEFDIAPGALGNGTVAIRLGYLYLLSILNEAKSREFKREDDNNFICGNCYFDLTDDD